MCFVSFLMNEWSYLSVFVFCLFCFDTCMIFRKPKIDTVFDLNGIDPESLNFHSTACVFNVVFSGYESKYKFDAMDQSEMNDFAMYLSLANFFLLFFSFPTTPNTSPLPMENSLPKNIKKLLTRFLASVNVCTCFSQIFDIFDFAVLSVLWCHSLTNHEHCHRNFHIHQHTVTY